MTPKDTAKEIHEKMYLIIEDTTFCMFEEGAPREDIIFRASKLCAIKAVELIITANPHSNPFNTNQTSTMEFWEEVKKELKK